jgi:hypothetical protein
MICYNNFLKIMFIIGLVLSISPITAYSIEASHYKNDSDVDMLTQVNHMEISAGNVDNKSNYTLNRAEISSQPVKSDIINRITRKLRYVGRLLGTIILMTSMTIPITFSITKYTLPFTLIFCMFGWTLTLCCQNKYS